MATRIPVTIPVRPWFVDHSFNGKVIFPAVETMLLLAEVATGIIPDLSVQHMSQASFSKLLEIPDDAMEITALVEYEKTDNGFLCKLLSKIQFTKISRIKEHAALHFSFKQKNVAPLPLLTQENGDQQIDAARIYQELVPFGPSYRSIIGMLHLRNTTAFARLRAPTMALMQTMETVIGSPFPLDGAMHAACVLGQCVADFVPFPVGFTERFIHNPTVAGSEYLCSVQLVSQTENELLFDLSIFEENGKPCETVKGLRMRDVTGGLIRPAADLPKITAFP
jgi:Polyketide synthase dehydratase N-terminal domain